MPDDEKRNRGLQAATEGNEATRITIMLIKVDPDTIGVALVLANETKLGPQVNQDHTPS